MIANVGKLIVGLLAVAGLLAVTLIVWPSSPAPLPDARRGYIIVGARVVDVNAGTVGPPTSIVVRDGIIAETGARARALGLVRVDGHGGFLVPGFWDMHVHSFQHSPQTEFPLFIANGVTSVRDMMDCPDEQDTLIACVSDKQRWTADADAGRMASPRFVEVASYYLEGPDLTTADVSARAAVYKARGLDALKVYNRLSRPAYFQASAEARRQGMRLVGHLPRVVALDEAIAAGQASFEHAHVLARHCFTGASDWRAGKLDAVAPTALAEAIVARHEPETCRRAFASMRAAGTRYVPTHVTREEDARAGDPSFTEDPRLSYLDPLSRWAFRDDLTGTRAAYPGQRGERALGAYFEHGLRLTSAAHRAGAPILVGTDTAIGGFRYHDEMAHLVRAGLSPADVLRAATIAAARYAGLDQTSGTVQLGKRADLVLLDANPLEHIANTRRIRVVFLNGRLYSRARLDELLSFARDQAAAPHNWAKLLWRFAQSSVTSDL